MKNNFASINVLLDESGSMHHLSESTIAGFNAFLQEQKAIPGEAIFSLVKFSSTVSTIYDCVPLDKVAPLDVLSYQPWGKTALFDALGMLIDNTGARLAAMKEEDRPDRVVVLVVTDGAENCSKHFTISDIKQKVSHQREVYSWHFVFLGANVDAFAVGTSIGISEKNSISYESTTKGLETLYRSISTSTTTYRSFGSVNDFNFIGKK
jgi:hypothetical protein